MNWAEQREEVRQLLAMFALVVGAVSGSTRLHAAEPATQTAANLQATPGERVPSEDGIVKGLHSLGLVEGRTNVFRSACPVRDLAEAPAEQMGDAEKLSEAEARMRHLHDLGVRTIISFEDPKKGAEQSSDSTNGAAPVATTDKPSVALERTAAEKEGIRFLSLPMRNSGDASMEDMSDEAVLALLESNSRAVLDAAKEGGVLYHCSAGHDRTGMVSAYIRMKYQHWPAEEAIAEMRRYGHNWPKFSKDGGQSSWHEAHLRAIEKLLKEQAATATTASTGDAAAGHSDGGDAKR